MFGSAYPRMFEAAAKNDKSATYNPAYNPYITVDFPE
jgi:hypothetical protein